MLLLLNSHIPLSVAEQLRRRRIDAAALVEWTAGNFRNAPDELVLTNAYLEGRVLVTYDCRTIPALLKELAESGRHHGGVVLARERTLRSVGGLVRALEAVASKSGGDVWEDRVVFFTAP